jgi:hypothetical protein
MGKVWFQLSVSLGRRPVLEIGLVNLADPSLIGSKTQGIPVRDWPMIR